VLEEGTFERSISSGYFMVVNIPEASTNIQVHHKQPSQSHLAIRGLQGKYYLNGNFTIDPPGLYRIAGTVFTYTSASHDPNGWKDSLYALGPINQQLVIIAMAWGSSVESHTFEYSYQKSEDIVPPPTVPPDIADHDFYGLEQYVVEKPDKKLENIEPPKVVIDSPCSPNCATPAKWKRDSWSRCSKTCGGGIRRAAYVCEWESYIVSDSECSMIARPQGEEEPCNQFDCPARY
jgi:hypothetical protein